MITGTRRDLLIQWDSMHTGVVWNFLTHTVTGLPNVVIQQLFQNFDNKTDLKFTWRLLNFMEEYDLLFWGI